MPEVILVEAVDRVVLAVRDIAVGERIYTRMLGREPSWRHTDPGGGTSHLVYRLTNTSIELIAPLDGGPWGRVVARHLTEKGEGVMLLYLVTPNAESAVATLGARGLSAIALPQGEAQYRDFHRRWRNVMIPSEFTRGLIFMLQEKLSPPSSLPLSPLRDGVSDAEAISALDHIVLMTADAEIFKRFLGDQLGIRLALDHSKPEWGVRQLFFRVGGVTIEVVQRLDSARAPERDHFGGLAWKAENIGALRDRLVREGAEVSEIRVGRKKGTEVATIRPPTMGVPTLLLNNLPANAPG